MKRTWRRLAAAGTAVVLVLVLAGAIPAPTLARPGPLASPGGGTPTAIPVGTEKIWGGGANSLPLSIPSLPAQTGGGEGGTGGDDPGAPPPSTPVVHSWALAPAGSTDGSPQGNRPTLSYELAPGSEVRDAVTLFNYSNVQLTFQVYATDAHNNDDGQFDLLPADQEPTGAGSWVSLPQEAVTLGPRSQATLPVTVRVPADARPGDHAGAVLAASQAVGTGPDGKVVTLDRRTGSRIYIRVDGPLAPELAIEDLHTSYRPALNPLGGTATVTYRVRNRGNVRLGGRHQARVSAPFGLLARRAPAQEVPELLPGESIDVRVVLDGVAATGVVVTRVDLEPLPVDGGPALGEPTGRRSMAFAPPLTLIALLVALGLLLSARRAYRRHQRDTRDTAPPASPDGSPGSGAPGDSDGPPGPGPTGGPDPEAHPEEVLV